jgi:hypothetical protein
MWWMRQLEAIVSPQVVLPRCVQSYQALLHVQQGAPEMKLKNKQGTLHLCYACQIRCAADLHISGGATRS